MRGVPAFWTTGLLLTAVLVTGGLPGTADGHTPDFSWEAPEGTTGGLVARLTFEPDEASFCWFRAGAAYQADPSNPVNLWGSSDTGGGFSWSSGHGLQVHAEAFDMDTREETASGGQGAVGVGMGGTIEGPVTWTVGASNLHSWDNSITGTNPFTIEVDCEDSNATVSGFGGSDEFYSFREDSMQGTGASASLIAGVNVQVDDSFFVDLESHQVITDILIWPGEVHTGSFTYHYPGGEDENDYSLLDSGGLTRIQRSSGPGTYGAEASRVSAGTFSDFVVGVFAGVEEVGSLDDLV